MREALNHLVTSEIHTPDFECDIDGGSYGLAAPNQANHMGPGAALSSTFGEVIINCHFCITTDQCHSIYCPFHLNIHWHTQRLRPRCRARYSNCRDKRFNNFLIL